jgi:hypothetical protein
VTGVDPRLGHVYVACMEPGAQQGQQGQQPDLLLLHRLGLPLPDRRGSWLGASLRCAAAQVPPELRQVAARAAPLHYKRSCRLLMASRSRR